MSNRSRATTVILLIVCLLCLALVLSGCDSKKKPAKVTDRAIMHEDEFGGVYIDLSIDDFNALGYAYGDSLNVTFSNGYKLEGIPYYNGYYTQNGSPLLVAYPGYPYIKACINNGDDLWQIAGLKESDKAEITLAKQGAFKDIQDARDIHYQDEREKFPSDEVFANFRAVEIKSMKADMLYRSASPCDNQHKRAPYVDKLMAGAGVQFILNLADTPAKIEGYISASDFDSPYFLSLYKGGMVGLPLKDLLQAGQVEPIALNMNFSSPEFRQKVANGLISMIDSDGPYLVHCTEGKDRTGFVCLLLEALCGASYQEIVDDYMITYDNYYKINQKEDSARYEVIVKNVLDPMVRCVAGDDNADVTKADLAKGAEEFLRNGGMDDAQIAVLKAKLMK